MTNDIIKAKAAQGQGDKHEKPDAEQRGSWMPPTSGAFHTFMGLDAKRDEKVIKRTVHATTSDVPQWLNWSEKAITWNR